MVHDVSSSDESIMHIDHYVGSVKTHGKQLVVSLELSQEKTRTGKILPCQLDTGTSVNVISDRDYNEICDRPKLKESNAKLHLYDGSWMKPLGIGTVYAKYNGQTYKLGFQVVPTSVTQKPLLSANTCEKLGLLTVHIPEQTNYARVDSADMAEAGITTEFADVFTGTGCFPGECHLELEPHAKPVQHVPRRVPVAIREAVKEQLDDMEQRDIIAKVTEPTDWISSMVVVKKPNKLRICINPKDLNAAIKKPRF